MVPGPECDEVRREAAARFIIQLARDDGSLDVAALHRRAVMEFGGPIMAVLINSPGRGLAPDGAGGERGADVRQ